jgi:hypothetical protein
MESILVNQGRIETTGIIAIWLKWFVTICPASSTRSQR